MTKMNLTFLMCLLIDNARTWVNVSKHLLWVRFAPATYMYMYIVHM